MLDFCLSSPLFPFSAFNSHSFRVLWVNALLIYLSILPCFVTVFPCPLEDLNPFFCHFLSCFKSLSSLTDLTSSFFHFTKHPLYHFTPGLLPHNLWDINRCDPEQSCEFTLGYVTQRVKALPWQSKDTISLLRTHTEMRSGTTNSVAVATRNSARSNCLDAHQFLGRLLKPSLNSCSRHRPLSSASGPHQSELCFAQLSSCASKPSLPGRISMEVTLCCRIFT